MKMKMSKGRNVFAVLIAVGLTGCEQQPLEPAAAPESLVVVRHADGTGESWSVAGIGLEEILAATGDSYWCSDWEDCWRKCPAPPSGGTVQCICTRSGNRFRCTVTYYGPGEFPGECGGREEDDVLLSCEDDALVSLDCPTNEVPRGQSAECVVSVSATVNPNALTYAWSSGGNSPSPGTGQIHARWGGVATETRNITVRVSGLPNGLVWTETKAVKVKPREWKFRSMTHPTPTYSVASGAHPKAWGGYETHIADRGTTQEVKTGPWAGEYYMDRPYQLRGHMHLHTDLVSTGIPYPRANGTNCSGVPYLANVRLVNDRCGLGFGLNLDSWDTMVRTHELEHEKGANNCLLNGSAAATALADMEGVTGTDAGAVLRAFNKVFVAFENGPLAKATKTTTSTPWSPVIWEWRDSLKWKMQALEPVRHNGTNGC